ncbi:hypothetical protein BXZ70DRAFT_865144, partial [Cristinia sonorae]
AAFDLYFPRLARFYDVTIKRMWAEHALMNTFFKDLPFAAQSLNLAQQAYATKHVDKMNLVFGICAILPFGLYNPRTSAQLVLTEPRLIIEIGPGDLFFFPSATIHHESIPMAAGEKRKSMIWYSAGSLFRWIKQGYQTAGTKNAAEQREAKKAGAVRWEQAWKLFCNIKE